MNTSTVIQVVVWWRARLQNAASKLHQQHNTSCKRDHDIAAGQDLPASDGARNEIEVAAQTLGLQLRLVPAVSSDDFVDAFAAMASERVEALIVMPSPMLFGEYECIVSIAANNKLPAMGAAREFVDLGGLMSYGAVLPHLARQAATCAYKILKGEKPAELADREGARPQPSLLLASSRGRVDRIGPDRSA